MHLAGYKNMIEILSAAGETLTSSNDVEDLSEIDAEDRAKLDPFIFTSPKLFQYPQNLSEVSTDNPEQLHSVRFQINARENSRVAALTNEGGVNRQAEVRSFAGPMPNQLDVVDKTQQNRLTAEQASTVSKGTAFIAGAGLGLSVIGGGANLVGKSIAAGTAGLITAGVSAGVIETVKTVRTLGIIELYISQPPIAQYRAEWENKELGALAGLGSNVSDASSFADMIRGTKGIGELGVRSAIQAAAQLPSQLGITGEIGSSLNLASGKVANPYKEQLFNYIDFRKFAFAYKFVPRNSNEYDNVKQIIQLFKYHMHPENDPTGLFLEYPSEFDIKYLYRGDENKELSRISTCALTDMKITYGNQDAFTTFKDRKNPGAPAEINIELAFTELETLTNDRIADGY
jgi:hypothetical protein